MLVVKGRHFRIMEGGLEIRVKTGSKFNHHQQVILDAGKSLHITLLPQMTKDVTAQLSAIASAVLVSEHTQASVIN